MSTLKEIAAADGAKAYTTAELEQLDFVVPWETPRLLATTRALDEALARVAELEAQLASTSVH
jgi:hypothetical protein